jgi:cell division protein FtsX
VNIGIFGANNKHMIELLKFIFSDVWYFIGTFLLSALFLGTIASIPINIVRILILIVEAKNKPTNP